jgi:hypothetical protein
VHQERDAVPANAAAERLDLGRRPHAQPGGTDVVVDAADGPYEQALVRLGHTRQVSAGVRPVRTV